MVFDLACTSKDTANNIVVHCEERRAWRHYVVSTWDAWNIGGNRGKRGVYSACVYVCLRVSVCVYVCLFVCEWECECVCMCGISGRVLKILCFGNGHMVRQEFSSPSIIYLAISKIKSFDLKRFFSTGCFTIPKIGKIGRPKFDGVSAPGSRGNGGKQRKWALRNVKKGFITCQVREWFPRTQ